MPAILCLAFSCAVVMGQNASPEMEKLAWISGCWKSEGKVQTEEQWTKLEGQSMLGVGRTIANGKTVFHEFLQIRDRADGVFYIAQPNGGAAVEFKLVKVNATQAVFENPQHDFPQRIIYQRSVDGLLLAAIEGEEKGKPKRVEFAMSRVRCD
ncbi:MAG TPA: DUF6265 family protein [Blastocatellia bacterium]|nr:DUF6265 family protein [Blastocatellia bacterium]